MHIMGSTSKAFFGHLIACISTLLVVEAQYDPGSHMGTTDNIIHVFQGRCWDYDVTKYLKELPRVEQDCQDLWHLFFKAFSYKPPCYVQMSNYDDYFQAAKQKVPKDKSMFWSGVFSLAHRYSDEGQRYVTLEDTLIGYLANSITWCGQSIAPGMNYTRCPAWDDCPLEAAESFWAGASTTFAEEASGTVHIMVDGSNPNKPAYRKDSFFGKYELPNLSDEVTSLKVIVSHVLGKPQIEKCGTGSLVQLESDVKDQGKGYNCVDDPIEVMHLLCAEDPNHRECMLAVKHQNGELSDKDPPTRFNRRSNLI